MARRTITALLLFAILVPAVYLGGMPFLAVVAAFFGIAASEYSQMFKVKGYEPSAAVTVAAVLAILASRALFPHLAGITLGLSVLAASTFHLVRYERGRDQAALDLTVALAGMTYLGWLGAYLLDLRSLQNGLWWLALVLVTVWVADTAAFFVGVRYGAHKMSPRLSPKKSWEGYLGGVVAGTLAAVLMTIALQRFMNLDVGLWKGAGLGLMLSTLTTLGDLGESLFKRFAGLKDSGTWLPGHGGAFDRIDSLVWAGALGYFWITLIP